jgi:hypothetical protein
MPCSSFAAASASAFAFFFAASSRFFFSPKTKEAKMVKQRNHAKFSIELGASLSMHQGWHVSSKYWRPIWHFRWHLHGAGSGSLESDSLVASQATCAEIVAVTLL